MRWRQFLGRAIFLLPELTIGLSVIAFFAFVFREATKMPWEAWLALGVLTLVAGVLMLTALGLRALCKWAGARIAGEEMDE